MKLRSSLKKTFGTDTLKKKVSFGKNEITLSKLDRVKKWLDTEINNSYFKYYDSAMDSIKYYNTTQYIDFIKKNDILYKEYSRKIRALTLINNKKNNSIEDDFYKSYYSKYCDMINKN